MAEGNKNQARPSGGTARNNVVETRGRADSTEHGDAKTSGGVQDVTARVHEGLEAAGEHARKGYKQASKSVVQNPGSSVLLGLGLGFGVGLALTALLTHREETWAERYIPDSLRNREMPDSVRAMPDAMHATFHHLAESIKDLPHAFAKMKSSR